MNRGLHPLLARQLRKLGLDAQRLPDASAWPEFLSLIDQTYRDTDQDRYTLERSLAISSDEMHALYQRQKFSYEARLRAIFITLQDLVWLKDTSGVYLACNPMFERFIGVSESKIIGKTDYDFASKERADYFREKDLIAAGKEGASVNEEWLTFADNGHQALFETVRTPMLDPTGQLIGVLGIARDITERKKAEEGLAEKEYRYRSLIESSPFCIHEIDLEGNFQSMNRVGLNMLGLDDEKQIRGVPYLSVVSECHIGRIKLMMQYALNGTASHFEFSAAGDAPLYFKSCFIPIKDSDGKVVKLMGLTENITERKRGDDLLHKSLEEIEDLYNNAPCGYHSLDKDGIIRRINDTELAWLGYTREEVLGKMKLTDLLAPDDIQQYHEYFPRFIKQGVIRDIEAKIIRKNGTVLVGLINATAIYDQNGNFMMGRSTVADLTERKRAEQQLHELSAHIQTVREEEKAHFAREIHDELGSTLAALKIDATRLASQLPADAEMLPFQRCAQSMSELLDNTIKSTRRIITDLRPSLLDDLGLMATLEWQCGQFHERTGIECRAVCVHRKEKGCEECQKCEYRLDNTLMINLYRISQEALTNVARHSGASRVDIEFSPGHSEVVLSVSDNGCGLPEGHTIAPTSYGMRSMRERVAYLGGKITFDNQPGRGLSVTVALQLPAANANTNLEL